MIIVKIKLAHTYIYWIYSRNFGTKKKTSIQFYSLSMAIFFRGEEVLRRYQHKIPSLTEEYNIIFVFLINTIYYYYSQKQMRRKKIVCICSSTTALFIANRGVLVELEITFKKRPKRCNTATISSDFCFAVLIITHVSIIAVVVILKWYKRNRIWVCCSKKKVSSTFFVLAVKLTRCILPCIINLKVPFLSNNKIGCYPKYKYI